MIIPRFKEEQWLDDLRDIASMDLWETETYVISPHPDDETLGAGGLIFALRATGTPVTVVAVTDGENAYEGEMGLGSIRELEQTKALEILGVEGNDVIRLRLKDSGLSEQQAQLRELLGAIIQPGAYVVAPWCKDYHPDHEICGKAAREVASDLGASMVSYFFWMWHRGAPTDLNDLELRKLDLSAAAFAAKNQALQCHRSQLVRDGGHPILPAALLGPMKRGFEVYLPL